MSLPPHRCGPIPRRATTLVGLLVIAIVVALIPTIAGADPGPPPTASFYTSTLSVTPGTQVALHWDSEPGAIFVLTSAPPNALPGFGQGAVMCPPGTTAGWNSS